MTLLVPYSFCIALFSQENIFLDVVESTSNEDEHDLDTLIRDIDATLRDEAPHDPPPLDLQAAKWSLAVLHWGCKTLLNRFETRTQLPLQLIESEPDGRSVSHHWSVDIGLRFLTDLVRRTQAAASDDSLIQTLQQIGERWPYSAVGISTSWREENVHLLLGDSCLRHLLFDRIQQRNDLSHSQLTQLTERYKSHIALPPTTL